MGKIKSDFSILLKKHKVNRKLEYRFEDNLEIDPDKTEDSTPLFKELKGWIIIENEEDYYNSFNFIDENQNLMYAWKYEKDSEVVFYMENGEDLYLFSDNSQSLLIFLEDYQIVGNIRENEYIEQSID